jgi:hypothetical protein
VALFAALVGWIITLSYGYADHDPRPHGLRISVSASASVHSLVALGLGRAAPGGFDVVKVTGARAAIASVRSEAADGALLVPTRGPVEIVTAGASGVMQQSVITAALTAVSARMHRSVQSTDVAPLRTGDHAGLSSFAFLLGLLIPSVLGSVGLFLFGIRFRLWWRVAAAALFALLAACDGTLVMDTIFHGLTGAGAALVGIGLLGALSFVLFVAACQAVIGLPGTGLAALALMFVGNAISGGSVSIRFLPDGFRQIAPWLPNAAIVRGVRSVAYFSGAGLGHALLVLTLWPVASLAVLAAVDLIHLAERRRAPHQPHEIYRTPGVVHASRRLKRRRETGAPRASKAS